MQALATRPNQSTAGKELALKANFFKFIVKSSYQLQKFHVEFNPPLPDDEFRLREKVVRRAGTQISALIGRFVFGNTCLYAAGASSEIEPTDFNVEFNSQAYTLSIRPVGDDINEFEKSAFFNKLFNTLQKKLGLILIGRKFFNSERPVDLKNHNLTIWPGYVNSVSTYEEGCLVNIDVCHRCLRTITVYDQIKKVKREEACRQIIGAMVLTVYNKRNYKIDDIDWDKTPLSQFSNRQGASQTFKDYYQSRWGLTVKDEEQPLLKSEVKGMEVFLIPELCVQTGLTDDIRNDFKIMKDMADATKKQPKQRLLESAELVKAMLNKPETSGALSEWKVEISTEPIALRGRSLAAGKIKMGDNKTFNINEQNGGFDREVQNKMFSQGRLKTWGVMFPERESKLCDSFLNTLNQVVRTFRIDCSQPKKFPVRTENWSDWDRKLREVLNPEVDMMVCILPGNRGKSRLYDDLKKLTFSSLPVPTQAVLTGTLKKDKGLRSVVNKLIMQINAKVGGTPWALENMPCGEIPTMVVGMDVFHKTNCPSVLGFVATTDPFFSKYTSVAKVNAPSEEVCSKLAECVYNSVLEFKKDNGNTDPKRIIVFRDGVSDSQRLSVLRGEVPQFFQAFTRLKEENKIAEQPKLLVCVVNKRINSRFYLDKSGTVENPPLGTCVDSKVVGNGTYEFFVCPARATQGAMTPTHFFVVYDDTGLPSEQVHQMAYRMCFGYYNWSGSIRVPAPCQYAHKLAYSYGEKKDGPPNPHESWTQRRCLYFL